MNFRLLITFVLLVNSFNSANGQITFQKTYGGTIGDYAYVVEQTFDGGYIIGGSTQSYGGGYFDIYLVKTNELGDTLWTRVMGDAYYNRINSLKQTTDGGYIITGFTDYDVFLMKMDSSGSLEWRKNYGFPQTNGGNSVRQTLDGGYIICGHVHTGNPARWHSFLIKSNSAGNTEWIKIYGGVTQNHSPSVKQTPDGGYILAGTSYEAVGGNPYVDIAIIKTDFAGDTIWIKKYGFPNLHDIGYSIVNTAAGYLITGYSSTGGGIFLMKLDLNGNQLWAKTYLGGFQNNPTLERVMVHNTPDNGYFISAEASGSYLRMLCFKTDSSGVVQWYNKFGGITGSNSYMESGAPTSDGGYILAGTTNWLGAGGYDMKLIKIDSLGNSGCYEQNQLVSGIPVVFPQNNYPLTVGTFTENSTPLDYEINSGGILNTQCLTVGVNENNENISNFVEAFPNPFNDIVTLNSTATGGQILFFDAIGRKVLESNSKSDNTIINTKKLQKGFYWIRYSYNSKIYSVKAVKI